MEDTLDRLVEIARLLKFSIALDPFEDPHKPSTIASLYGSVHAALDIAHVLDAPNDGSETREDEWDKAVRNGYVSTLREIQTSDDAKGAFFHKMLLAQAHRIFELTSNMQSLPTFAASAAIAAAASLIECQYNVLYGNKEDNFELRLQIIELCAQLERAVNKMFSVSS